MQKKLNVNIINIFFMFLCVLSCLFLINKPLNADNDTIQINTTTKEESNEKVYKKLIESYGYSADFDIQIISNPIERKRDYDPNKKYYIILEVKEIFKNQEMGYSAIDMLTYTLDVAEKEYVDKIDGDIRSFKYEGYSKDLTDIAFLLNVTGYIATTGEPYEDNSILAGDFSYERDKRTALTNFVLNNAKFDILYKTNNDIVFNENIETVYKTNEGNFNVYKISLNPASNEPFVISESLRTELDKTNSRMQLYLIVAYNFGFFMYYLYWVKNRE